MDFLWSLSDNKSPQVSRTLLSILADLSNAIVWMASTRPFISKSFNPFINPAVTVPRAPIIIGINVTSCFTVCFFLFPNKVEVFIFLFTFFYFYFVVCRDSKAHNFAYFLLFVDYPEVVFTFYSPKVSNLEQK